MLLAWLAVSIGILYSCQKEPLVLPAPAASVSNAMQAAFEAAGHGQALLQPFGSSAQLYWAPNWRAAYAKTAANGIVYTYVPLTPSLRAQQRATAFQMVGTAQYIIAKHIGEAYQFYLATYTVAQPDPTPAGHKRRTLAEAAAQPVITSAFTGKLFLKGLTLKGGAVFVYKKGLLVKSQALTTVARGPATSTTNAYECVTIYRCYWQAYCTRNGAPITYGAITTGINGCDPPSQEACGIDNWGMSWDSNGSDTQESCTQVDDPPTPTDPGDPSGGGEGDDTPTNQTNVELTISGPKINPRLETRCFDATQDATLTIYVQQANPGTRAKVGPNQVGHTFVGIEQNGITRYMGYYPSSSASTALVGVGVSYPGELHDNSGTMFNVSISSPISSSQLTNILNYINNFPGTYNLNSYNCADFGIAVGNLGGMNLPNTTTQQGFFNGRSPGDLGEDIRAMSPPTNGSIDTAGGNAPIKQGTCPPKK